MRPVTLDASVVVKWFHPVRGEGDLIQAEALRKAYGNGDVTLFQPPHWRAEVASVLVRLSPRRAFRDVEDLCLLDAETIDEPDTYLRATGLAADLGQHVFDTLYHAVALSVPGCTLITADRRFFSKAKRIGGIAELSGWPYRDP